MTIDAVVLAEGTIYALIAISPRAKKWVDKNVQPETYRRLAGALCVEHKQIDELVARMRGSGLTVFHGPEIALFVPSLMRVPAVREFAEAARRQQESSRIQ